MLLACAVLLSRGHQITPAADPQEQRPAAVQASVKQVAQKDDEPPKDAADDDKNPFQRALKAPSLDGGVRLGSTRPVRSI